MPTSASSVSRSCRSWSDPRPLVPATIGSIITMCVIFAAAILLVETGRQDEAPAAATGTPGRPHAYPATPFSWPRPLRRCFRSRVLLCPVPPRRYGPAASALSLDKRRSIRAGSSVVSIYSQKQQTACVAPGNSGSLKPRFRCGAPASNDPEPGMSCGPSRSPCC